MVGIQNSVLVLDSSDDFKIREISKGGNLQGKKSESPGHKPSCIAFDPQNCDRASIGGLILINVPTFGFASSSSGGADQSAAKMHLDEAIKALQAGDTSGAKVHMTEADKVIQEGGAKMHLDEAIKAIESGDTAGAETHAQMAQDSL